MSANNKGILNKVFSDIFSIGSSHSSVNNHVQFEGEGGRRKGGANEDEAKGDAKGDADANAKGDANANANAKGDANANANAKGDANAKANANANAKGDENANADKEGEEEDGDNKDDTVQNLNDCKAVRAECDENIDCEEGDEACLKEAKTNCEAEEEACKEDNEKTEPQQSMFSKLFSSDDKPIDPGEPHATGPIAPLKNAGSLYKRVFIIGFIFCLAVYLASVTFRSKHMIKHALKIHGEKENADTNFDADDVTNSERLQRIMKFICLFVLLTLAYFTAIIIALVILMAVFLRLMNHDADFEVWKSAGSMLSNFIWQFEINGEIHSLLYIYGIIVAILVFSTILFLAYFVFVKDYLTNLYYPHGYLQRRYVPRNRTYDK